MAFSNLFTKLSDVKGAVHDSRHRNEFNRGQEGSSKRNPEAMQTGPQVKRQRLHSYGAGISDVVRNEESKAPEAHRFDWAKNNQRPRASRDVPYKHHYRENANHPQKTKKKKNKGKKKRENAQIYKNAQRNQRGRNQDNAQPRKPFFSQEFKEKHSLEVDGRLLCIYFLRGRCIKGEECQFEHIEGYNGLIKEACKFYIEGFCLKGKNCPYLHETFPCKFFHSKGRCRRAQCMFSHDPLTDVTKKLLDDFLQLENELLERRKRAEEEALRQTENVSEAVEETLDIIIPTAMPSFYQSAAVEDDASTPDEEQPTEDDKTPQTENNEEPEDALPSALEQPGPVCYSVEAMLGPRLFKPCLYTAPKSQEASQSESKTTSDSASDVLYSPYSFANVLKSSTTSSHLHSPSIAPAVVSSHESKYTETGVILEDKYSVSPCVLEKTFNKPPSFYDCAPSGYLNKQCEKTALKPASSGKFKANGELTIWSSTSNSTLEDEKITTECKREYKPLMRSNCLTQNYLTAQVQKDKFGERDSKLSHFKDKPSLENNGTFLSKTLPIQQNSGETNSESETSLKNDNPCNKTTRLNSLFASLTPDVDQTSALRDSVSGKTSESDCASQKVHSREAKKHISFIGNTAENTRDGCSSKIKRKETEIDVSHPSKKCLLENLPQKIARTSTVNNSFSHKSTGNTSENGSNQVTKPSQFTRNTSEITNSNTSHLNLSKKLVSTSATANQEKDVESANTPPAKSFQSLFTSLTSDSDEAPTVCNSFSDKPTVPSAQKHGKSFCASEKINYGSNKATKPSQFTRNTSESTNRNTGNLRKTLVSTCAAANLKCSNEEKDIESGKTHAANTFQSLFTSLAPDFERTSTACNSFSDKPDVPRPQKVEKTTSPKPKSPNPESPFSSSSSNRMQVCSARAATSKTQSKNSQGLMTPPATSKLQDSNITHDTVSAKTPPTKSFQSLFTSLTPDSDRTSTDGKGFGDKQAVSSVQKHEKSICASEKINCSKITDNRSESTKTIMTNLKCSKKEEDIESAKTPPAKSFQSLFTSLIPDSDQASTVSRGFSEKTAIPSAQKVEKSVCASEKINSSSNKATKPSPFIVNTSECRNDSSVSNDGAKLISTSATANVKCAKKEEDLKSAKTPPEKSFQSLFKSLTPDSDQASTFISTFSEKTSAKRGEQSFCDSKRIKCKTLSKNGQRFVSPSATSDLKSNKQQEDVQSAQTPPAKSFQSLFTSLAPDSGQASSVSNSFSEKTAVSSTQNFDKSVCANEKMDYGSENATESSPFTGNTTVSQQLVSVPATDNLKCSKKEEDIESGKTPSAKSFQSLFTSLAPDSGQASTVSRSFSDEPDVLSAQEVEKSMSDGHKNERDLNQARKQSQKFVSTSGTSDFKSKNQNEDVECSKTPVQLFQSLFASLTPTIGKSVKPDASDLSADNVERSIHNSQKDNCQTVSTTERNQFTENLSESTNNGSSSRHREVDLVSERTETSGKSAQKWDSPSATSNFKTKNDKDDTDSAKSLSLSPEVDQTSTVQPQKHEKSLCDGQKATKQINYNESTTGSKVGLEAARMETLNDNRPKSVSSAATQSSSKEENGVIGGVNAPARSFHHLFSAPLDESAVSNDPKTPRSPDPFQSMDDKLSNVKTTSSQASNTENKRNGESKNEHGKNITSTNSSSSNTAPANQRLQHQTSNGSTEPVLKSLFQQLRPFKQQTQEVGIKSNIHPG